MQPIRLRLRHRRLRHFVWVALFAWVFALAVGVANACIVAVPGAVPPGHGEHWHPSRASGDHDLASPEPAGHATVVYADHEYSGGVAHDDAGKAGCLKFCDDESSALPKSGILAIDQIPAHVAVDGLKIQPAPVTDAVGRLSLEQASAQGPPLVIRLLRLAL